MIAYILTPEQQAAVQGQLINAYEFINCVQDIDGTWFFLANATDRDRFGEYAWLFDLPEGEFIPPLPTPFPYETN